MLYIIYPNVTNYCNVTYKNVHFTLRYTIVDISSMGVSGSWRCLGEGMGVFEGIMIYMFFYGYDDVCEGVIF